MSSVFFDPAYGTSLDCTGAINGNTSTVWTATSEPFPNCVLSATWQSPAYWLLNLGQTRNIHRIIIYPETKWDNMRNISVQVDGTQVFQFPDDATITDTLYVTDNMPIAGQIITLTSGTYEFATLCELQLEGCSEDTHGKFCNETCNTRCQDNGADTKCDSITGHCVQGCVTGWHGLTCEEPTDTTVMSTTSVPNSVPSEVTTPSRTFIPSSISLPSTTPVPSTTSVPTATSVPSTTTVPTTTSVSITTAVPNTTSVSVITSMTSTTSVPTTTSVSTTTYVPTMTAVPTTTSMSVSTSVPSTTPWPGTVSVSSTTSVPTTTSVSVTTYVPSTIPVSTTTPWPGTVSVSSTTSVPKTTSVQSATSVQHISSVSSITRTTSAPCGAGQFINTHDNGRCTPCPVGQYQEGTNHIYCEKCPAGSTTPTTGAVHLRACEALPEVRNTASVRLRYVLLVVCTQDDEVRMSSEVHAKFVVMQSDWSGLCRDSACSNAHVTSTCEGPTSKIITNVIAVEEVGSTLTSRDTNMTLPTSDAFLQAILENDRFNLQETTGARLLKDAVSVSMAWACKPGYVRSGESCVTVAASKAEFSAELIGSIAGGGVGVIAVVLLVVVVVKLVRTSAKRNSAPQPEMEHPYDSLESSAAIERPRTDRNPRGGLNPIHQLDSFGQGVPRTERTFQCVPPEEPPVDYDYLELQYDAKDDYLTPVVTRATVTSSLELSVRSRPELPSRAGVQLMRGVSESAAIPDRLETFVQASRCPPPAAHSVASISAYITPTVEGKANC